MTWPDRRTLVIAGVVAAAVVLVAGGGWLWYGMHQNRVATAHAAAMAQVSAARAPQAPADVKTVAAAQLEQFIAQYPSAPVVPQAAYELGNLKYESKQYSAARSAYEIALASGASPTVRTITRVGVGYTWEAEREYAKAIEVYQVLLKDLGPKDFMFEETLIDLGRAQELAGKKTEAAETYRRLLKDVPSSRRADQVRTRLGALEAGPR